MSIFNEIQKTQAEKRTEVAREIILSANGIYGRLEQNYKDLYEELWQNSNATPQQIADLLGTRAGALFQATTEIQNLLAKINPSYVALNPPNEYTINQDGTVTIGDPV